MLRFIVLVAALTAASCIDAVGGSGLDQQRYPTADKRTETLSGKNDRAVSMLEEVASWIASNFELPLPRSAPTIAFASQIDLMTLRTQDRAQWQGFKYEDDPASQRDIVAVYNTATATIYLPLNWTGITPGDQSVLVHEMVHHLRTARK